MFKKGLSEAKFTSEYLKIFKQDGWAFKIPDIGRTIKPFDRFGVNEDGIHFCEVKISEKQIFDIGKLRNNQITSLKRISEYAKKFNIKNIKCYVLVYWKDTGLFDKIDIKEIMDHINNKSYKIKVEKNKKKFGHKEKNK